MLACGRSSASKGWPIGPHRWRVTNTGTGGHPTPSWQSLDVGGGARLTRLVVTAGADAGRVYELTGDALVGRSASAVISLTDGDVSRRHAFVHVDADGSVWVEDLDSRNSTFVNGQRTLKRRLEVGDRVRFGADAVLTLAEHDPLQAQLIERQRYECIGRLSMGVAHDFNNMLGAVAAGLDYIDSAGLAARGEREVEASLQDMRTAVQRASQLARRLLLSAKRGAGRHEPQDLTDICEHAVELAARTMGRHIEVVGDIERRLVVRGDAAALHQVLINLFVNARDAMPDGGRLMLTAHRQPPSEPGGAAWVLVSVSDEGVGMDAATQQRAFEAFFTTKDAGAGFGLGLTTVKEIIAALGGEVELQSAAVVGTTVRLRLPLEPAQAHRRMATAVPRHLMPPAAGTRILLADDEPIVRRSLKRVLVRADYQVIDVANGREAVEAYRGAEPKPAIVLLDMEMPELDGAATCVELLQLDPAARIVVISGGHDAERARALRQLGALDVLNKPISSSELLLCLGEVQRQQRDESDIEDTQRIKRGTVNPER